MDNQSTINKDDCKVFKNGSFLFCSEKSSSYEEYAKIQEELWQNAVGKEVVGLQKMFEQKNISPVKNIDEIGKQHVEAAQYWNQNFEQFREYKGHIYHITLKNSLGSGDIQFTKWTVQNFIKEMSHFYVLSQKFAQQDARLTKIKGFIYATLIILLLIAVQVLVAKFIN